MVILSDWENCKVEKKVYIALFTFISILILYQYLYIFNWIVVFRIILLITLIGLILGLVVSFLGKKEIGWLIFLIFILPLIFIMGILKELFYMTLIIIIIIFVIVLCADYFVTKRKSSMKIYISNKTSIVFYKALIDTIEEKFEWNKFDYKRQGNILTVFTSNKEKIKIMAEMNNIAGNSSHYEISLITKSKDIKVDIIKKIIYELIFEMDEEKNIDRYSGDKKYYCRYCSNVVWYIYATDQYYCKNCRVYKELNEVEFR